MVKLKIIRTLKKKTKEKKKKSKVEKLNLKVS
jgi:hypothetical protein